MDKQFIPIATREYSFDSERNCVKKKSFNKDNQLVSYVQYLYDKKGNKIESLRFSNEDELLLRYVYIFKDNLKVKCIKIDYLKDQESHKIYEYNGNRKCTKTLYFKGNDLDQTLHTTYNEKGECISRIFLLKGGSIKREMKFDYSYDTKGRIVEKIKRDAQGNETARFMYSFNDLGQRVEYTSLYTSDRISNKKRVYQFDAEGNRVHSTVFIYQ